MWQTGGAPSVSTNFSIPGQPIFVAIIDCFGSKCMCMFEGTHLLQC